MIFLLLLYDIIYLFEFQSKVQTWEASSVVVLQWLFIFLCFSSERTHVLTAVNT